MKQKILSIIALVLLITTASAAVFITYNPEARIYFGIDKPADVETIVTSAQMSNGAWSNSFEINVTDTIVECALKHENPRQENITGDVHITIFCDAGLDLNDEATIFDFSSVEYTDINGVVHECNSFDYMTEITLSTVTYEVPGYVFEPGYSNANIMIDLVGMAYGNYRADILVVET